MITTTVSIDPKAYKELRLLAVEENTNVRVLIRRAVHELLKRRRGWKRSK